MEEGNERGGRGNRGRGRNGRGNGGRGRGGRGYPRNPHQNNPKTDEDVKLYPPNVNRGTLSNFTTWKECLYKKAKDITKHMHRLILTDEIPTVYHIMNRQFLIQVFGALNEQRRLDIIDAGVISAEQAANIPLMGNNAESRRFRKKFDELSWDILKELDEDMPKIFNLVYNSLGRDSEELIKGNLGENLDIVRTESDIIALWECIINSHNNGAELSPVDMNVIRQNYYTVKMQSNESLANFHARFENLETNMRRIDPHFDANTPANYILFVEALDNKRFGEFKTAFMNDINKPEELRTLVPEFRGMLYERVKNYITINKYNNYSYDERHKSAYVTQKNNKNDQNNKKGDNDSKPFIPKKGYKGCNICGGLDHLERTCKIQRDDAKKIIAEYLSKSNESKETKKIELTCKAIRKNIDIKSICLDTMSQINIFNIRCPHLVNHKNVDDGIVINGIGNDKVSTNTSAEFKGIKVYTSPYVNANILSFSLLNKMKKIKFDNYKNEFILNLDDEIMIFKEYDDLYKCHEVYSIRRDILSNEEMKRVEIIKSLYDKLAFPADKSVEEIIKRKMIKGLYVDLADYKNYKRIYPKRIETIRGKSTKVNNSYIPISDEQRSDMIKTRRIDLAVDIFYVSGYIFILGVNLAYDLTMVRLLRNRSRDEILKALQEMIDTYAVNGWNVNNIYSDEEKGVIACEVELLSKGVRINYVSPGSHVAVAERKIRTIKDKARSLLQTLKYKVPISLLPHLILYTVTRINQTPTVHTHGSSPREVFNGDMLDFERDLPLTFGQKVEIINPVQTNDLQARSEAALYIGPSNYGTNSHYFYTKNGHVVLRQDYVVVNDKQEDMFGDERNSCIDPDAFDNENVNLKYVNENDDEMIEIDEVDDNMKNLEFLDHGQPEVPSAEEDPCESEDFSQQSNPKKYEDIEVFQPNFNEGQYFDPKYNHKPDDNYNYGDDDNSSKSDDELDENDFEQAAKQHDATYMHDDQRDMDLPNYWKTVNKIELLDDLNDVNPELCKNGIMNELMNMKNNEVWESIPSNVNVKAIPCKIFVKPKRNSNGDVTKIKARLTAGGHLQNDVDYAQSFSPTSSINTVMLLATIHAKRESRFTVIDVTAAYLNASMNEEIYMKIDDDIVKYMIQLDMVNPDHVRPNGSIVVKLKRALYGTKQAGRAWFEKLNNDIINMGYKNNDVELGVYTRIVDGVVSNIIIYVDDIVIMAPNKDEHVRVVNQLKNLYNDVTISSESSEKFEYLGLTFTAKNKVLYIEMSGYVKKILVEHNNVKHVDTPYTKNLFMNREIELLNDADQTKMRSSCAKILYLAKRIRPDILLPIIVMSSRFNKYNADDKGKMNRIFNYIASTKDYVLKLYDKSDDNEITLNVFVDASYGIYLDGKGQSAYGFTLGSGMFLVKSNKQKSVGKSSTGAEIIAIDDAACEAVHQMNLINAAGFKCNKCVMHEDNESAIKIVTGGIETMKRTKFMRVRIANVREIINENGVELKYCPTENMPVDILTKPIGGMQFKTLRDVMLGYN